MKFGISTFVTDEGVLPGKLGRGIQPRGFVSLLITEHTRIPLSRKSPYPGTPAAESCRSTWKARRK